MPSPPTFEFVPYLSISDAERAVAFYTDVFGVAPHLLLNLPDGRVMHCEFRIANARFFLSSVKCRRTKSEPQPNKCLKRCPSSDPNLVRDR